MKLSVLPDIPSRFVILAFVTCVYILATIFSDGYHHPDEHFQIIEFAGLKAGWNDSSYLTWEYDYQIRPSLQPYLALVVMKFCSLLGTHNPFFIASVLRVLTAALAIYSIFLFMRSFMDSIDKKNKIAFLFISFCLWFLPIINIRFSSETWAGLCLLISIALIEYKEKNTLSYFIIGITLGLSFEFRFQMALCFVGLFPWLFIIKKVRFKNICIILAGFCAVILLCTFLDYMYYGSFVIAPYNYFKVNLIDKVANSYGVSPWYYYITEVLNRPSIAIGLAILSSFVFLLIFKPKSIVLWCIIPYLLVHFLIAHKETRFLFPLANFVPLILIQGYQLIFYKPQTRAFSVLRITLVGILFLSNLAGLLFIFKPAGYGQVNLATYIYKTYYRGQRIDLYTTGYGPISFGTVKGGTSRFYMSTYFNHYIIEGNFHPYISQNMIIAIPMYDIERRRQLENAGYVLKKRSIPEFIQRLNGIFKLYDEGYTLLLFVKETIVY